MIHTTLLSTTGNAWIMGTALFLALCAIATLMWPTKRISLPPTNDAAGDWHKGREMPTDEAELAILCYMRENPEMGLTKHHFIKMGIEPGKAARSLSRLKTKGWLKYQPGQPQDQFVTAGHYFFK